MCYDRIIIPLPLDTEMTEDITQEEERETTGIEHSVADADDDVIKDCGDETEKQKSYSEKDHDFDV